MFIKTDFSVSCTIHQSDGYDCEVMSLTSLYTRSPTIFFGPSSRKLLEHWSGECKDSVIPPDK